MLGTPSSVIPRSSASRGSARRWRREAPLRRRVVLVRAKVDVVVGQHRADPRRSAGRAGSSPSGSRAGPRPPSPSPRPLDEPGVVGGRGERRVVHVERALQRRPAEGLGRLDRPQPGAVERLHDVAVTRALHGVGHRRGRDRPVGAAALRSRSTLGRARPGRAAGRRRARRPDLPSRPPGRRAPRPSGRSRRGRREPLFVDELGQRKAWVDAINTVLLQGNSPANAVKRAAAEEQKILDGYYK